MSAEHVQFATTDTGARTETAMIYGDEINFLNSIHVAAQREQIKKAAPAKTDETTPAEVPATNKKGEEIKAELDDLLDEIDGVLEENAEEFVRSYVQKGGQ